MLKNIKVISFLFWLIFSSIFGGLWLYQQDVYIYLKKMRQEIMVQLKSSQFDKMQNLKQFRIKLYEKQQAKLHKYQWKSKTRGLVTIPIDKAIDYYLDDRYRDER